MMLREKWLSKHNSPLPKEPITREPVVNESAVTHMAEYRVFDRKIDTGRSLEYICTFHNGVMEVFRTGESRAVNVCPVPGFHEFVRDFITVRIRIVYMIHA